MARERAWRASASAVHLLHRASQVADELFARTADSVLTPRQFVILATVADAEGINQKGIIEATGIDRSSTAELVQRLVRRGLLRRRRIKRDARSYAVRLTPEGRALVGEVRPAAQQTDIHLLGPIGKTNVLLEMLERLVQAHSETSGI